MSDVVVLSEWTQAHRIEVDIECYRLALSAAEVHDFAQARILCTTPQHGWDSRWAVAFWLSMRLQSEQDIAAFFARIDAAVVRNYPVDLEAE